MTCKQCTLRRRSQAGQWRALWMMMERWHMFPERYSPRECAKELREHLKRFPAPEPEPEPEP